MQILITGCSGFIGFHVSQYYLKNGKNTVIGIDSLNSYYSKKLKNDRLSILKKKYKTTFKFFKININSYQKLNKIFSKYKFKLIIHLAAQAGVRYSLINPKSYINSNILGFYNILELAKINNINHLVFASSSSVYGDNKIFPLKESDNTDKPIQLYAATKKSNEIIAHAYCNLYKMKITSLRFFTVYGPWGRPDMSLFKFVNCILKNKSIDIYNNGNHIRDFTYIDDLVNGIKIASNSKNFPKNDSRFRILNIGSNNPIKLMQFINLIEKNLGKKAKKKFIELQKGDIHKTHADIKKIQKLGYVPKTKIEDGIKKFIQWYKSYYNVKGV